MDRKTMIPIAGILFVLLWAVSVNATVYTVCSSGCNSTTIQGCIDYNASAGDTCNVTGTYNENVTINKSIYVIGNNTPELATGGFNITEDNASLEGFLIQDGMCWDPDGAGNDDGCSCKAVEAYSADNITVNDIIFNSSACAGENWPGDGGSMWGIYLSSVTDSLIQSNNLTITGGNAAQSGVGGYAYGIYLVSSTGINAESNNFTINGGSGGSGNPVGGQGGYGYGAYVDASSTINLSSSVMDDVDGAGGGGSSGEANAGNGGNAYGVYALSDSNLVDSNTIENLNGGTGGNDGATQNGGHGGSAYGIYLSGDLNNVSSNVVNSLTAGNGGNGGTGGDGGDAVGIYLTSSSSNNLSENNITSCTAGAGWTTDGTGGDGVGIYFLSSSSLSNVTNNVVNSTTGGAGGGPSGVAGDSYGLYVSSGANNTFYLNTVISVTNYAVDDDSDNMWNTSYPTGGNYWGNYTGLDDGSGSYPHNISGDNIGDNPHDYAIGGTAGSVDYLPLLRNESADINSHETIPATPLYNQNVYISANVTDSESDTILYCNYTITMPNGTVLLDNSNGTQDGDLWNSSNVNATLGGVWNYSITAVDSGNGAPQTTTSSFTVYAGNVEIENAASESWLDTITSSGTTTKTWTVQNLGNDNLTNCNASIVTTGGNPSISNWTVFNETDFDVLVGQSLDLKATATYPDPGYYWNQHVELTCINSDAGDTDNLTTNPGITITVTSAGGTPPPVSNDTGGGGGGPSPPITTTIVEKYISPPSCGDNICGDGENFLNCPVDCPLEEVPRIAIFLLIVLIVAFIYGYYQETSKGKYKRSTKRVLWKKLTGRA